MQRISSTTKKKHCISRRNLEGQTSSKLLHHLWMKFIFEYVVPTKTDRQKCLISDVDDVYCFQIIIEHLHESINGYGLI
jgi:hypothetical protein